MTAPPNPFLPNIQATTTIYIPHATKAIDALPPYHGLTFQEKDIENGIVRPHDVYPGAELRRVYEEEEERKRVAQLQNQKGFSFLSIPSEESGSSKQTLHSTKTDDEALIVKTRPTNPIWKSKTNIPPSSALLGSVGLFRPTIPEHKAGMEFHRRQRRQQYPDLTEGGTKPPPVSRAEAEDYMDALRGDAVERNTDLDAAMDMLMSPEEFVQHYQSAQRQKEGKSQNHTATAQTTLTLELKPESYKKWAANRKGSKRAVRRRKMPASGAEEGGDPNINAVKQLFHSMNRAHGGSDAEEETSEEEEETSDVEADKTEGHCDHASAAAANGYRAAAHASLEPVNVNSVERFSPSARHMFDLPHAQFEQVPRGTACIPTVNGRPKLAHKSNEIVSQLSPEGLKLLRWIFYQEEYERTLLVTEEQECNPIPYYGSFVAAAGDAAFQERMRRPPELRDVDRLHRGVDEAIDKAVADVLALEEQRPPRENALKERRPSPQELFFKEVVKTKNLIYNSFASLHGNLKARLELVQEEKKARLAVLGEFISCTYPKPCPCLLLDMEILEESGVELEPKVPPACVFVSAVLSLSYRLHDDLLAKRQIELDYMKKQLDCLYFSSFVYERFVDDESRQWGKIVLYHQYCMQLASKHHKAAALWCREKGLDTLEESDEENAEGGGETCSSSSPAAAGAGEAAVATKSPQRNPNRLVGGLHRMDLKAMRRSRLHCRGPNDSPFCSYLKFLEVVIGTVLEQDGREMVITDEKREVAGILQLMAFSLAQSSVLEQEREDRERLEGEELQGLERMFRELVEWDAAVSGAKLGEYERFARQDLLVIEVRNLQAAALEGAQRIANECSAEYTELWRRIHNKLLILERHQLTREEELQIVNGWASEEPRQFIYTEQSRHRMKVMREEERKRSFIQNCFLWLKDVYIPARDRLEFGQETSERSRIVVYMEEDAARIALMAEYAFQHNVLFERVLLGAPEQERIHTPRLEPVPNDLNIRLQVISDLNLFTSSDELADIFQYDTML